MNLGQRNPVIQSLRRVDRAEAENPEFSKLSNWIAKDNMIYVCLVMISRSVVNYVIESR